MPTAALYLLREGRNHSLGAGQAQPRQGEFVMIKGLELSLQYRRFDSVGADQLR